MRKEGGRVRITAQLNDVATGSHIWAEHYDRDLTDVFAVQDEITDAIVAAIEPQIYAAENFRARRKPPNSLGAWDLVMQALSHYWRVTQPGSPRCAGVAATGHCDRSALWPGALAARHQPHVRRPSRLGRHRHGGAAGRARGAGGDRMPTARTPGRIPRSAASVFPPGGSTIRWPSSNWRCSSIRTSRWRRAITPWRCPMTAAGRIRMRRRSGRSGSVRAIPRWRSITASPPMRSSSEEIIPRRWRCRARRSGSAAISPAPTGC